MTTLARLAAEVEALDLEQRIAAMRQDLQDGLVPPDVRRPLYDHERTARTNFAEIEDHVAQQADYLARRAKADRQRILALLDTDLRATANRADPRSPLQRIALRLFDLDGPGGLSLLPGADEVLNDAQLYHRGRLEVAAARAGGQVLTEAKAQGLPVADIGIKLEEIQADQLDLLARRLAQAPHGELLRALRDQVIVEEKAFVTPDELVDRLHAHARGLAESPIDDVARSAVQQADAIGRVAGATSLPTPKAIYASELLDRRTCGPCSLADGKQYDSMFEARADYPHGTYRLCEGGIRCRGTLVFVWPTEADPTLQTPGDETPTEPPAGDGPMVPPAARISVPSPTSGDPDRDATAREAARALELVGQLHSLPAGAARVPLTLDPDLGTRTIAPADGEHGTQHGRTNHIAIWTRSDVPAFALTHEVGHFLDVEALGAVGGYATVQGALGDVMTLIKSSSVVADLRALLVKRPGAAAEIKGYWLSEKELWARAYAQWVAERTGDRALLAALSRAPFQWTTEEFVGIGQAIDVLLASLGFGS